MKGIVVKYKEPLNGVSSIQWISLINLINCMKRYVYWDFNGGYRKHKYFSFSNISDLIDQYNYIGYHDVCVYPGNDQLVPYKDPDSTLTKGVKYVFGGIQPTKSDRNGIKSDKVTGFND